MLNMSTQSWRAAVITYLTWCSVAGVIQKETEFSLWRCGHCHHGELRGGKGVWH